MDCYNAKNTYFFVLLAALLTTTGSVKCVMFKKVNGKWAYQLNEQEGHKLEEACRVTDRAQEELLSSSSWKQREEQRSKDRYLFHFGIPTSAGVLAALAEISYTGNYVKAASYLASLAGVGTFFAWNDSKQRQKQNHTELALESYKRLMDYSSPLMISYGPLGLEKGAYEEVAAQLAKDTDLVNLLVGKYSEQRPKGYIRKKRWQELREEAACHHVTSGLHSTFRRGYDWFDAKEYDAYDASYYRVYPEDCFYAPGYFEVFALEAARMQFVRRSLMKSRLKGTERE